jgi:molecular chaperone HscB
VSAPEPCPHCGTIPASALVCEDCGELLEPRDPPSPFEVFGLEPAWKLDLAALSKRRLALTRALHPDFHGTADAETRRLAEDGMAALNQAHALLSDDFRRADWLVTSLGGPRESEERGLPPAFLQEVLEWNETIESAKEGGDRGALVALERTLNAERGRAREALAAELEPLPKHASEPLRRARQILNSARYLERALRELGELALSAKRS